MKLRGEKQAFSFGIKNVEKLMPGSKFISSKIVSQGFKGLEGLRDLQF
jgi:hypothetical protein